MGNKPEGAEVFAGAFAVLFLVFLAMCLVKLGMVWF